MKYPLLDQLNKYIAEGFATARAHPRLPLQIYNYSTRAQYNFTAETWPQELRDARGLVLDPDGEIIARGFRKFFNLSQLQNWPAGKPEFWEKADGSLIIVFDYKGEVVCSTRGSFESEQAKWAASMIPNTFVPQPGITYCLEAIYPANRIVVDYQGLEELVLLGAVDHECIDRDDVLPEAAKHFRRAKFHGLLEMNQLPVEQQGEGFVLRWPDGTRAKVKLDEYTRAHRLLFGLSTRAVWEMLAAGEDVDARYAELPALPRDWAKQKAAFYRGRHSEIMAQVREEFVHAPVTSNRGEFAAWAKTTRHPGLHFKLLDGKPIEPEVWKLIEPKFERPEWVERIEEG